MRRSCFVANHRLRLEVLCLFATCWLVVPSNAQAVNIAVDFGVADSAGVGTTPNDVQGGFSAFDSNGIVSSNAAGDSAGDFPITRNYSGVGVTVAGGYQGASVRFYDGAADVPGGLGDLVEDGVQADLDGIRITLADLAAGEYEMTFYTHIASNTENTPAGRIYLIDGFNFNLVDPHVSFSFGEFAISTTTFEFTSDGDPVEILLEASDEFTGLGNPVYLNGFVLNGGPVVPEPSTWALVGIGALGVGLTRLRTRAAA